MGPEFTEVPPTCQPLPFHESTGPPPGERQQGGRHVKEVGSRTKPDPLSPTLGHPSGSPLWSPRHTLALYTKVFLPSLPRLGLLRPTSGRCPHHTTSSSGVSSVLLTRPPRGAPGASPGGPPTWGGRGPLPRWREARRRLQASVRTVLLQPGPPSASHPTQHHSTFVQLPAGSLPLPPFWAAAHSRLCRMNRGQEPYVLQHGPPSPPAPPTGLERKQVSLRTHSHSL